MSTTISTSPSNAVLISTCLSSSSSNSNTPTPQSPDNLILVKQASDLSGVLDSTKVYRLDGSIDMGSQSIEVPAEGLSLIGYTFDISKVTSSVPGHVMFTSPVGGSGNLLCTDLAVENTGANSKVYDLTSATGFSAIEFTRVNWNNCADLGDITNYRQGLETGTGRFGGSPTLCLHGQWIGGYYIESSIVRGLDAGMTTPLYKAGVNFSMLSRFRSNQNIDLPPLAPFIDFSAANFPNASTLQLDGCIITRGGVSNANDNNIIPNISKASLASAWTGNFGINNTFIGGAIRVIDEVETTISSANVAVDLDFISLTHELEHFSSPDNIILKHMGNNPREFKMQYDMSLQGASNREYRLSLIKINALNVETLVFTKTRVINNLQGGRDVAFFTGNTHITLDVNEACKWQVTNLSGSQNCTVETDSTWNIEAR